MMKQQSGVILLEALVAISIFAIGILGMMGLQAAATRNVTDENARIDATMLAQSYIAEMHVAQGVLAGQGANTSANCGQYWFGYYVSGAGSTDCNGNTTPISAFTALVQQTLPGGQVASVTVTPIPVTQVGGGMGASQVFIQLTWIPKGVGNRTGSTTTHQLTINTQI